MGKDEELQIKKPELPNSIGLSKIDANYELNFENKNPPLFFTPSLHRKNHFP